ncbi:MAG: ABC transporter substrate-binding protein [bacterium]|nr:ABC transporter substrate-binding protein [Gammaproteobacteria bacterium]
MITLIAKWFLLVVSITSLAPVLWAKPKAADYSDATRVVSLDYCADQFVLKLVDKQRIRAISMDARQDFSYMRKQAELHRQVRASAENVLALAPDLIVRSYGGGPNAERFYRRLGLDVIQVRYTSSIAEVQQELLRIATALGKQDAGNQLVEAMNQRLNQLRSGREANVMLYVTPGGVTSGPGTLVHDMIKAAGLSNFQTEPGWRSLPLEKLAFSQPELLATAFFDTTINHSNFWSAARHPIIRGQLESTRSVVLDGATTACGGWFLVDAVERLAESLIP